MLGNRVEDCEQAARGLAAAALSDAQIASVEAVRAACLEKKSEKARSPMEQLDREEAIAEWLAGHGLDTANAGMLADTEVTLESLDQLVAAVPGPAANAVVRWAASGCVVRNLASKIQDCATRVSSLVAAVKGFTHMDQANVAEPVAVEPGLRDTVEVLRSKAREKSVAVTLELEAELPKVRGLAGELNQVWSNLIENAVDAARQEGRVEVLATRESQSVVVRIVDDGPGVAEEIRSRIFDPFFTTKPLGQGIGLGLDIVRRLVRHNHGAVDFESQPGRTEFRVILPVVEIAPAKAAS
jgi:signal transduction histidine kinase